ncbi:HIT family protein [Candidatus Nitronereus thalassa]|uniref:HIT family protein n=1 Tax=Candidatus Nitronereus thalassa TaxID=3020898 RepID=A0ABU3KC24_9BACT|nr:HIT family protein [Candidatus Nitronereus thalassa]MDT7043936.1 HIT family protein [Candidatus Nitronereus thalassa]
MAYGLKSGINISPLLSLFDILLILSSMADTIFKKILSGEIPCHKVYEDEQVLAFLDINPLSKGHTLVIPKEPAETLDQLSDESSAAIGRVLPRLCRAVLKATGARDYNILQNNGAPAHQAVFHVHYHIIPKEENGAGLGIGWKPTALNSGADLARSIASCLDP